MLVIDHTTTPKSTYDVPMYDPFMRPKHMIVGPEYVQMDGAFLKEHIIDSNKVRVNWDCDGNPYSIVDHFGYRTYTLIIEIMSDIAVICSARVRGGTGFK